MTPGQQASFVVAVFLRCRMSSPSPGVSTVRTSERFDWDNASRAELVKTPFKPAFLPNHAALKTRALLLLPLLLPTYVHYEPWTYTGPYAK